MVTDLHSFEMPLVATNELDLAFHLKDEQKTALKSFLCKDNFAVLPIGYSKSLIYQLASLISKHEALWIC